MKGHDIVLIGASAGGLAPLQEIVAGISPDLLLAPPDRHLVIKGREVWGLPD